ncbi:MAG: triose-phosphate isomerase [Bdellovibrionales bacterium]|nr:triose-phosphate isomerase [Bdellovibrionales bacterium]
MTGFFCAGNWKMNKTPEQAAQFVRQLKESATAEEQKHLVLLPTALIAYEVAQGLKGSGVAWGGQNCYFENSGAFTGESSPSLMKEMGAKFCLVGHSERRQIFAEPDDMLAKKTAALQNLGMIPIVCVGETQDDRRWNRTQEVIVRQTRLALASADPSKPIWLAYEPVWAIGTGQVATPEQVEEAHGILRKALKEWSAMTSDRIPILYGGSVKAENSASLAALNNVNGFLIGGASLAVDDLLKIYRNSQTVRS